MLSVLKKEIHVSWFLALASCGVLVGLALSYYLKTTAFNEVQWLIIGLSFLLITLAKRIVLTVIVAVVAGTLLGLWRGGNALAYDVEYQQFIGDSVLMRARVSDDVVTKNGVSGIKLDRVIINGKKLAGDAWAGATTTKTLKRDDVVELQGKLEPGFGKYNASMGHAKLVGLQRNSRHDLPRKIRDNFTSGLKKSVPEPSASLGAGYIDGQHNQLPQQLVRDLQLIGLIHIVIAGGYNVTILIRYIRKWLSKISKYLAALGSVGALALILSITGFSASVSRTVVITLISLATWYYGRKIHPLVLLPLSAAITTLAEPSFINGAVGWYLTFIAYGGLIILGPLLHRYFWDDVKPNNIRRIFVETLSVQIVTMPLLAYSFQQYSIYGLVANLLVLPLMPITILFVAIAGISGIILPASLAHVVGWPATFLLTYTERITTWLANAPGAHYSGSLSITTLIVSYLIIILVILYLWRKTNYDFRDNNLIE